MSKKSFSYTSDAIPEGYQCSKCNLAGVKLWRQYQTFADHIRLLCVDHALENQNVSYTVDEEGYHTEDGHGPCVEIEWLVPAVPDEENETFWGHTSTPQAGWLWWKRLPLKQVAVEIDA